MTLLYRSTSYNGSPFLHDAAGCPAQDSIIFPLCLQECVHAPIATRRDLVPPTRLWIRLSLLSSALTSRLQYERPPRARATRPPRQDSTGSIWNVPAREKSQKLRDSDRTTYSTPAPEGPEVLNPTQKALQTLSALTLGV